MRCPRCNGTGEVEETLGQTILWRRANLGLTQEQLAARAEVSRNTISLLERDSTNPSVLLAMRVIEALGGIMQVSFPTETKDGGSDGILPQG